MEPIDITGTPSVVLDTNVVLDWLLFDEPSARAIGRAIVARAVRWIATPAMRDEHFGVIGRASLARWSPDAGTQRRVWDAHCLLVDAQVAPGIDVLITCTDAQDQMFVDLAVHRQPRWLLSRDKALLALATQLRPHGVLVTTAAAWAREKTAPEAPVA